MCCYPDVLSFVQHGEPVDRLRVFVLVAVLSSAGIPEFVRLNVALQADSGVVQCRCLQFVAALSLCLQLQLPLVACT